MTGLKSAHKLCVKQFFHIVHTHNAGSAILDIERNASTVLEKKQAPGLWSLGKYSQLK